MDLNEYQELAHQTDEKKRLAISVHGLVGEVGSVLSIFKKRFRHAGTYPAFEQELKEELGDALWYLSSVAKLSGITLEELAKSNLSKSRSMYDEGQIQYFDKDFPDDEQLPRRFDVEFLEKEIDQSVQVKIYMNGVIIGDALTDNSSEPDGYRYHDAFHFANVAILGWSPVVRAILHRKRKSDKKIDEVQDGARAKIVEEAISLFIFEKAPGRDFYKEAASIDFGMLQTIQSLVGSLEVKVCTAQQWKQAIFKGYEMFRLLCENKGGRLHIDIDQRMIEYEKL